MQTSTRNYKTDSFFLVVVYNDSLAAIAKTELNHNNTVTGLFLSQNVLWVEEEFRQKREGIFV